MGRPYRATKPGRITARVSQITGTPRHLIIEIPEVIQDHETLRSGKCYGHMQRAGQNPSATSLGLTAIILVLASSSCLRTYGFRCHVSPRFRRYQRSLQVPLNSCYQTSIYCSIGQFFFIYGPDLLSPFNLVNYILHLQSRKAECKTSLCTPSTLSKAITGL